MIVSILGIVLIFLVGICVLFVLSNDYSLIELIGLAFPIGIGVQTFGMFIFDLIHININLNNIVFYSIFIIILTGLFLYRKPKTCLHGALKLKAVNLLSPNIVWLVCAGLVCYILFAISAKSLFWPTFASDSMSSFDVFAKAIANEGKLMNSLILEKRVGYGAAYPPLYSLSLAYTYIFNFELSKIIPTLFFISFTLSFYALTTKLCSPTLSVIITLLLISSPEFIAQSAINITNVPQATYASLAVITAFIWYRLKESKYLYVSVILLSFNSFIRSEGIVYFIPVIFFIVFELYGKRSLIKLFVYLLVGIIPFLSWQIFLKLNTGLMEKYTQVKLILIPRIDIHENMKILELALDNIMNIKYFGISFYAFMLLMVLNVYNLIRKKEDRWILFLVIVPFVGYLFLLNQLELKADTIENIINYSGKRFFFGTVVGMWFFIACNTFTRKLFTRLEDWLKF